MAQIPGDPPRPKPSTATELEGGAIPTTQDEWQSRQEWTEYQRRRETEAGLRDVAQTRAQADLEDARARVFASEAKVSEGYAQTAMQDAAAATARAGQYERMEGDLASRAEHYEALAGETTRSADVRADLLMQTSAADAADQRRAAQIASVNIEALEAEVATRQSELGGLAATTAAQVAQRQAQIEQVAQEATFAMQDASLEALREEAEAQVMSAARGAGGQVVEAQKQQIQLARARQVGRIGDKAALAQQRLVHGIKEVESRADMARARVRGAVSRAEAQMKVQGVRAKGALARADLIQEQATVQAGEIRTAAGFESAGLMLQSGDAKTQAAGLALQGAEMAIQATKAANQADAFRAEAAGKALDARAAGINADFARQAADEGLDALIDRPPIPDWNAIGRDMERAQRWQRASSIVDIGSKILGLF